ncbi:hypothetical protein [Nostoc sp. 'Peltigera malacea cyanobiont' DB3992]|uniref:hypothetical protein n=1 Tax=Nostoc sp. 'Peltigera malacea cyanobiont' DB3992 TaxID=1206980 RepID=UPI00117CA5A6|nr:hypothetical protein [Nostoc sp. 'Peltigera malacea cyanobiont' DB3992]
MNKTQYTFIPSSQSPVPSSQSPVPKSPVPSPLPLRVIQKSKTLDSAALATQERLTRYRFAIGLL